MIMKPSYQLQVNYDTGTPSQHLRVQSIVVATPGDNLVTISWDTLQAYANGCAPKRPIQVGDLVEFILNKDMITDLNQVRYRGFVNGGCIVVPLSVRTNFCGRLDVGAEARFINIDASLVTITKVVSVCMNHYVEWPVCPCCGEVLVNYQKV